MSNKMQNIRLEAPANNQVVCFSPYGEEVEDDGFITVYVSPSSSELKNQDNDRNN